MGSVFAFIIFILMISSSSVRFILDLSTELLLDIFLPASTKDITRGVGDYMYCGFSKLLLYILLNL